MTRYLKNLCGVFVWLSGISWFVRHVYARRKVSIVVYHDPSPERLDAHLSYLEARYNIIPFPVFAEAHLRRSYDELPDRPLVVTIDDGHAGNARLRDVFERHGIRPLIYLCSQIVGTNRMYWWQSDAAQRLGVAGLKRVADDDRLARLAERGFEQDGDAADRCALGEADLAELRPHVDYGAHTRFHPILPQCRIDKSRAEIAGSRTDLMERFGIDARHFAYPGGEYTDRDVGLAREAGYRTARTTRVGWNTPRTDPFRLRALPSPDGATLWWLRAHLTGIPGILAESLFRSKRSAATGGRSLR